MAKVDSITVDMLRETLEYDPKTGVFTWKKRCVLWFKDDRSMKIWNTKYSGKETFTSNDGGGYNMSSIKGIKVKAHRAAWAIHYGEWPREFIDHINLDPSDNRIVNLRQASNSENMRNSGLRSNNTSGARGVYWCSEKLKWAASIRVNGKNKFLGRFESIDAAKAAYAMGSNRYHGEFGRVA